MSDEGFVAALKASKLSPKQISNICHISITGARLWLAGKNLPYGMVRERIIQAISFKGNT